VSIVRLLLLLFSYCHIDFFSVWVSATALSCPSTPRLTLQKVPRSNLSATAVLALLLALLILVALKLVLQKNCLLEQLEIMCIHPATHRLSEDSKGAKQSSALSGSIARMLESIVQQQEGRQVVERDPAKQSETDDRCFVCSKEGELLLCDFFPGCVKAYHQVAFDTVAYFLLPSTCLLLCRSAY